MDKDPAFSVSAYWVVGDLIASSLDRGSCFYAVSKELKSLADISLYSRFGPLEAQCRRASCTAQPA